MRGVIFNTTIEGFICGKKPRYMILEIIFTSKASRNAGIARFEKTIHSKQELCHRSFEDSFSTIKLFFSVIL